MIEQIMPSSSEWGIIVLSVRVAFIAVFASSPLGLGVAYVLARYKKPFVLLLDNLVQIPLVIPPIVTGYVLLIVLGPEGPVGELLEKFFGIEIAFTWLGAVVAAGIVSFPLLTQSIRVALEQIDPEWEEACYVYGGNRWAVFRFVTLPLAARGIAAGVVLAFARALGEFGATIVIAGNIPAQTRTIPLAIFTEINRIGGEPQALRLVLMGGTISVISLFIHAWLTRRFH